jgi:hypothetical protein
MRKFEPTQEHAFYALALIIAIGLRFIHLGGVPLSDFEANWALQALHVAQGLKPAIGSNPAYVHLTAILFFIFGATNFLARFWPAVAGCILILGVWILRGRIGRAPALILAFGLAIDPGLVAMSRMAGGSMLAVTFVVFTGLMWFQGRRAAAGFFGGMALLSGSSFWFGLAGIGLAWLLGSLFETRQPVPKNQDDKKPEDGALPSRLTWNNFRLAFFWGLGTLLVVGSLFLLSPKGLPAAADSFWVFLSSWWKLAGVQVWRIILALPAYEILPLALGVTGLVRAIVKRNIIELRLGIFAFGWLLLVLVYPGRQTGDLIWMILPLWVLAALELARHLDFAGINLWEVAGTFIVVVAFVIFAWLNLASITNMQWGTDLIRTRIMLVSAVVLLIILSLLLIATGWSIRIARLGGVWGGFLVLTLFTIAMSTGAGGLRQPLTVELWQPEPRTGRVDIIVKVASQISDLNRGVTAQLPLTIMNVNSPALEWAFRSWQIQDVTELAPDASPALIISSSSDLSLSAQYRGEPLVLHEAAAWSQATPTDWLKWFVYRQMPMAQDKIVLWVRDDLMLDSQDLPTLSP